MQYNENEGVRLTPEYEEARMLILERAVLQAEILITDAQIKRLHNTFQAAVQLAKADAQQTLPTISDLTSHSINVWNKADMASSNSTIQNSFASLSQENTFHCEILLTEHGDICPERGFIAVER